MIRHVRNLMEEQIIVYPTRAMFHETRIEEILESQILPSAQHRVNQAKFVRIVCFIF